MNLYPFLLSLVLFQGAESTVNSSKTDPKASKHIPSFIRFNTSTRNRSISIPTDIPKSTLITPSSYSANAPVTRSSHESQAVPQVPSRPLFYSYLAQIALDSNIRGRIESARYKIDSALESSIFESYNFLMTTRMSSVWAHTFKRTCRNWKIFGQDNEQVKPLEMAYYGLLSFFTAMNDVDVWDWFTKDKYDASLPKNSLMFSRFMSRAFAYLLGKPVYINKSDAFPVLLQFFGSLAINASPAEMEKWCACYQAYRDNKHLIIKVNSGNGEHESFSRFVEKNVQKSPSPSLSLKFVYLVEKSLGYSVSREQSLRKPVSPVEVKIAEAFKSENANWMRTFGQICSSNNMFGRLPENFDGIVLMGLTRILHAEKCDITKFLGFKVPIRFEEYKRQVLGLLSWMMNEQVMISDNEIYPFFTHFFLSYFTEANASKRTMLSTRCGVDGMFFFDEEPVSSSSEYPTQEKIDDSRLHFSVSLLDQAVQIAAANQRNENYFPQEQTYLNNFEKNGIIKKASFQGLKDAIANFFGKEFPGLKEQVKTSDMINCRTYESLETLVVSAESIILNRNVPKPPTRGHFLDSMMRLLTDYRKFIQSCQRHSNSVPSIGTSIITTTQSDRIPNQYQENSYSSTEVNATSNQQTNGVESMPDLFSSYEGSSVSGSNGVESMPDLFCFYEGSSVSGSNGVESMPDLLSFYEGSSVSASIDDVSINSTLTRSHVADSAHNINDFSSNLLIQAIEIASLKLHSQIPVYQQTEKYLDFLIQNRILRNSNTVFNDFKEAIQHYFEAEYTSVTDWSMIKECNGYAELQQIVERATCAALRRIVPITPLNCFLRGMVHLLLNYKPNTANTKKRRIETSVDECAAKAQKIEGEKRHSDAEEDEDYPVQESGSDEECESDEYEQEEFSSGKQSKLILRIPPRPAPLILKIRPNPQ